MTCAKRLIDANESKRRIIAFATGCHTEVLTVDSIIMILNQSDTVDAVEVVHARWAFIGEECCVCSACHNASPVDYYYCPECGAKMDGERKDNGC